MIIASFLEQDFGGEEGAAKDRFYKIKRRRLADVLCRRFFFASILIFVIGCQPDHGGVFQVSSDTDQTQQGGPDKKAFHLPENCDFTRVKGLYTKNECTPQIKDLNFRGIVINAPREVSFKKGATETPFGGFSKIPICGRYIHDLSVPLPLGRTFEESMIFVAVDARTNKAYSGKIQFKGTPVPPSISEDKKTDKKDLSKRSIGGYFNPNLSEIVDIPVQEGEYLVYVTLGSYKSNVVRIKVAEAE